MMIHDSFATTANRVDDLHSIIRDCVSRMFEVDYLSSLYEDFSRQLPDKFKEKLTKPPERGQMQLQEVKNSLYFFS